MPRRGKEASPSATPASNLAMAALCPILINRAVVLAQVAAAVAEQVGGQSRAQPATMASRMRFRRREFHEEGCSRGAETTSAKAGVFSCRGVSCDFDGSFVIPFGVGAGCKSLSLLVLRDVIGVGP
jgi:hypothetical protein